MSSATDESPLLCTPEEKPVFETANAMKQLEYIEFLIVERRATQLRMTDVRQLQSLAIERIYPCGGRYRNARDQIRVGFFAPHESQVPSMMDDLCDWVNAARAAGVHGIVAAAYVMWRINWIHPFSGGNGRSARAAAYLVLGMFGRMVPPGRPMPAIIEQHHDDYIKALKDVDASILAGTTTDPDTHEPVPLWDENRLDIFPMVHFVHRMLMMQLAAVVTREQLERINAKAGASAFADVDQLIGFVTYFLFIPTVADQTMVGREGDGTAPPDA